MIELRSTMVRCVLWASMAALLGCGSSHTADRDAGTRSDRDGGGAGPTDGDGGTVVLPDGRVVVPEPATDAATTTPPDAMARDAAVLLPDGGRPPRTDGLIGTPCTSEDDCEGRFCSSRSSGLGYCSWVCADDVPCPDDAVCVDFSGGGGYGYCLASCGPSAVSGCPSGTVCTSGFGLPEPVCLAGCEADDECPTGTMCGVGFGGVGQCFTPDADNGRPCTDNAECSETSFCADEATWGFSAGICLQYGCSPSTGTGCGDGTVCVEYADSGLCLPTCATTADCRTGYDCVPSPVAGVDACVPRCMSHDQCSEGRRCDFLTGRCFDPSA